LHCEFVAFEIKTMAKPIHQEVTFNATPQAVYDAYMNPEHRAQYTEGAVEISQEDGGSFSAHGGIIVGRNVELIAGQRIVQAWRNSQWPEGLYTTVHMELTAEGDGTKLVMDHYGVPDESEDGVASGWEARYWEPMKKFLG